MNKTQGRGTRFLIFVFGLVGTVGLLYLGFTHIVSVGIYTTPLAVLFAIMFVNLSLNFWASISHRASYSDPRRSSKTRGLSVAVIIPVYNEDPALLAAGLDSLRLQTRVPDEVWITDDGSTNAPLTRVEVLAAITALSAAGVDVRTQTQPNLGKRHAQAKGFASSRADIYVTIDSDTVLDLNAIEEILVPFEKANTMAVAGIVYGQNHRQSLLTRIVELGFSTSFMSGRAAEGFFGAVRVNCGILAAYRGRVVRENLDRYLGQTFFGAPATFGDDRALTILAREEGDCLYQPTAIAYSALPSRLSHLIRQRLRWAKSWFWGTRWLLSRPTSAPEFWLTFTQILSMICYFTAIITITVLAIIGVVGPEIVLTTVLVSALIGMFSNLRYVFYGRQDVSFWDRVVTWSVSPLSSILYILILTPLYLVALFTLRQSKWGTRQTVEVGLYEKTV